MLAVVGSEWPVWSEHSRTLQSAPLALILKLILKIERGGAERSIARSRPAARPSAFQRQTKQPSVRTRFYSRRAYTSCPPPRSHACSANKQLATRQTSQDVPRAILRPREMPV